MINIVAAESTVETWLWTTWTELWLVPVSAIAILLAMIAVIRVAGLRSLSKMSSFDFAVTVALGSIMAAVAASSTSLVNGAVAVATLLTAQAVIALARRHTGVASVIDNTPLLLMEHGEFLEGALDTGRVTRADVLAKLREANVLDFGQVRAVVLESTGDVSVLHGDGPVDPALLDGVRRAGRA